MEINELYPHSSFEEQARDFFEKYRLRKIIKQGDQTYARKNLKHHKNRICRFCGLGFPETSFSNYAHLVPQLIGNRNLYSDFECDRCNERFSKYENDLAEFIGISRSIVGVGGNSKSYGFQARRLSAKSRSFMGNDFLIIAPEDVKKEGEKTKISYVKNAFIPSKVYKALLKSALSILDDIELADNYGVAIKYLKGHYDIKHGAFIGGYNLSFSVSLPLHIFFYEKKSDGDNLYPQIVSFQFQNHIISLPIPFHKSNLASHNVNYDFIAPPPIFSDPQSMIIANPMPYLRDLSGNKKIPDEEESIIFEINPLDKDNLFCFDPKSDKVERGQISMSKLKYLVIMREGVTIDPKNFSEFIRKQMGIK